MTKKRTHSQVNNGIQAQTVNAQAIAVGTKAQAIVNQQMNASVNDIAAAFSQLFEKINQMPGGAEKDVAKSAAQALEKEAQKGPQAEEATVSKWFSILAQMAPDVFEVALTTFANPIQGLGVAFQKIAQKAGAKHKQ